MGKRENKTKRRIRKLIEFDTAASNSDIARALGISRQAVSQHVLNMRGLPVRQKLYRSCAGCLRRVRWNVTSGLCRRCWVASFAYEFVCAHCGAVRQVLGKNATNRRALDTRRKKHGEKAKLNFCTTTCANKFFKRMERDLRKLDQAAS